MGGEGWGAGALPVFLSQGGNATRVTTVVPFCTSHSSPRASKGQDLSGHRPALVSLSVPLLAVHLQSSLRLRGLRLAQPCAVRGINGSKSIIQDEAAQPMFIRHVFNISIISNNNGISVSNLFYSFVLFWDMLRIHVGKKDAIYWAPRASCQFLWKLPLRERLVSKKFIRECCWNITCDRGEGSQIGQKRKRGSHPTK